MGPACFWCKNSRQENRISTHGRCVFPIFPCDTGGKTKWTHVFECDDCDVNKVAVFDPYGTCALVLCAACTGGEAGAGPIMEPWEPDEEEEERFRQWQSAEAAAYRESYLAECDAAAAYYAKYGITVLETTTFPVTSPTPRPTGRGPSPRRHTNTLWSASRNKSEHRLAGCTAEFR